MTAALLAVGTLWLCASAAAGPAAGEAAILGAALLSLGGVQLWRVRGQRRRQKEADRLSRALFVRAMRKKSRGAPA